MNANNTMMHAPMSWNLRTMIQLSLAVMLCLCTLGSAQAEWPVQFGDIHNDFVKDVAVDSNGNTYVLGEFETRISFSRDDGNPPIVLNGASAKDLFIAKYNAAGKIVWARSAIGTATLEAYKLDIDSVDNLYIAGFVNSSGTATFGSTILEAGVFLAHMDSAGNWIWARRFEGWSGNSAMAASPTGDGVYVANVELPDLNSGFVMRMKKITKDNMEQWSDFSLPVTHTPYSGGFFDFNIAAVWPVRFAVSTISTGSGYTSDIGLVVALNKATEICGRSLLGEVGYIEGDYGGFRGAVVVNIREEFIAATQDTPESHTKTCTWATPVEASDALFGPRYGELVRKGSSYYYAGKGFVTRLNTSNGNVVWRNASNNPESILLGSSSGSAQYIGLDVDDAENVYLSGVYIGSPSFGSAPNVRQLPSASKPSLFVAKMSAAQEWQWVSAAVRPEGDATAVDVNSLNARIALSPAGGRVHVAGRFTGHLVYGSEMLSSLAYAGGGTGPADGYLALIDANGGNWLTPQAWTIGTEILRPEGALAVPPDIEIEGMTSTEAQGYFFWNSHENKLYAIRPAPGIVTINWKITTDTLDERRVSIIGSPVMPAEEFTQRHVADTTVALEPATAPGSSTILRFLNVVHPAQDASQLVRDDPNLGKVFSRAVPVGTQSPYVVLHYTKVNTEDEMPNPANQGSFFQVVYTRPWNEAEWLKDNQPCTIGSALNEPNDPGFTSTGRAGYVVFEKARYDGVGVDAVHNRNLGTGPIVPVNKDTAANDDDMAVVWFSRNAMGQEWGDRPYRYRCEWPSNPPRIVIADQQGSGPLDGAVRNARIYNQPNRSLAGFNPNEEHALLLGGRAYALRNDLNSLIAASDPYVLLKYQDANNNNAWAFQVYQVVDSSNDAPFAPVVGSDRYTLNAGMLLQPPQPLTSLPLCGDDNRIEADPDNAAWQDHKGGLWARAAGDVVMQYHYPLQEGFYYDLDNNGEADALPGSCVPWLDRLPGGAVGTPVDVAYRFDWPAAVPVLSQGESVFSAKEVSCSDPAAANSCFLPTINGQAAAQIIFDEHVESGNAAPGDTLVTLFDPLSTRSVSLNELAGDISTTNQGGRLVFNDLPYVLRVRLDYDTANKRLRFSGWLDDTQIGDPHLLPNVMSSRERDRIKDLPGADNGFKDAVDTLYALTRNPNGVDLDKDDEIDDAYRVGLQNTDAAAEAQALLGVPMVLSAGKAADSGYVTVAFNNHPSLGNLPVSLQVLRVGCDTYQGNVWIVPSDNIFEEALTLRHSGDFAGDPDDADFQWYYQPDVSGQPAAPADELALANWVLHPGSGMGALDITIEGPGLLTLSDNWFVTRYRRAQTCAGVSNPEPVTSAWAGDPAQPPSSPKAMLALGWIKRVIGGLNPFDQRFSDFRSSEISTLSSMIAQAGSPYSGPIPFNPDPNVVNNLGLIEAYQTVLERGKDLSIDAGFNDVAANTQLLNVATRIADMYTMLGNEAYADAQDPTIGFDTGSELGSLASSIFSFQNQLDSPLEEELVLLRGRDDTRAGVAGFPVYNRLFWNFTQGEGEVAYVQSYGITDQNSDGFINETDARRMFPQGHGDAWGHYLTSVKSRYSLLQEPNFTWIPRPESVLVAGVPIQVDYLDERKFAASAAAKAMSGAEIVNLTYRQKYVEAPAGQWQGYKDTNQARAWGVDGWARRAGQGAYFDWLTANAILPAVHPDPTVSGIAKVDRTTVPELGKIIAGFNAVQAQMDQADAGLNPLGVAKGAVPFDIDPSFLEIGSGTQGQMHFEQIASRAQGALDNAVRVFNHASQQTQSLRRVQDDVNKLSSTVAGQERDYKNQLIEIFGYPYAGNIGGGKLYPSGYDGPDVYHYMYVSSDLTGDLPPPDGSFSGFFSPMAFGGTSGFTFPGDVVGDAVDDTGLTIEVGFPVAQGADWSFVAPSEWGNRRAPGELQLSLSDMLQAQAQLQRVLKQHQNLLRKVEDSAALISAEFQLQQDTIEITTRKRDLTIALNVGIGVAHAANLAANRIGTVIRDIAEVASDAVPKTIGLSNDMFSVLRAGLKGTLFASANGFEIAGDVAEMAEFSLGLAKEHVELQAEVDLAVDTPNVDLQQRIKELEQLWREEAVLRLEIFTQHEVVQQSMNRYYGVLARGERLLEARRAFRVAAAGDVQSYRYRDMTFRIFRNDALQKYRAQFDLAARYVYLAATAYDYETNLLGSDSGAGRKFLADIVRQRSLGQVIDGTPIAGTPGLADVLGRLTQNFAVYRGQLGFNNPQVETNRFSLRRELFRIRDDSDEAWRKALADSRVDDLWQIPEFRRYARPFAPESMGPQPGLVFRFPTTVNFGLNYFGHELGGGDSAYDPTNFATKVRSVGTWFANYDGTTLSNTPRIYLLPVGMDVMRSPSGNTLATREWRVVDQRLPVPFPIGASDLTSTEWIPINDSLSGTFGDIRRYSSYRAYHDSGIFNPAETATDSRLVGRSVWNTEWLLIIPGGTLLNNPDEGLERFIAGQTIPGQTVRDGNGVSDIMLFFQTYGFSGN